MIVLMSDVSLGYTNLKIRFSKISGTNLHVRADITVVVYDEYL